MQPFEGRLQRVRRMGAEGPCIGGDGARAGAGAGWGIRWHNWSRCVPEERANTLNGVGSQETGSPNPDSRLLIPRAFHGFSNRTIETQRVLIPLRRQLLRRAR